MEQIENGPEYPETIPQSGPNVWDVLRVLSMPMIGLFRGFNAMFEQIHALFVLQSQIHDEKKASRDLANSLK